jgi:hypothetical protein
MTQELANYLESIRDKARLDVNDEPAVMSELEAHIEDKIHDLKASGLSEEEAVKTCIWQMGSVKSIAQQMYEAYSQGSWKQVSMAALPHFVFGAIFMLNWWHYPQWLAVALLATVGITVYGWGHGKPTWVFTWLGYSLLPVVVVGILLLYIPSNWSFISLIIYFPLALWWILRLVVQTIRRDWLLGSMMLLPIPIIIGWFLAVAPSGKISDTSLEKVNQYAPWIGLTFMMLAFTIGTFIRLRQRWLRIGLLAVSGIFIMCFAAYLATGEIINALFLGPIFGMWGILLLPPLLEKRLRKSRRLLAFIRLQKSRRSGGLPIT